MDLTAMRNLVLQHLNLGGVATDRLGSPVVTDALNRSYKRLAKSQRIFHVTATATIDGTGKLSMPSHWCEVVNIRITGLGYPLGKAGHIRQFDLLDPMWRDTSGAPTDYAPLDGDEWQVCPPPTAPYQEAVLEGYAVPDGTTIALLSAGTDSPSIPDHLHEALVYDAVADLCAGLLADDGNAANRRVWADGKRDEVLSRAAA